VVVVLFVVGNPATALGEHRALGDDRATSVRPRLLLRVLFETHPVGRPQTQTALLRFVMDSLIVLQKIEVAYWSSSTRPT